MNEVWVRTNPRIYFAAAAGLAIVCLVPGVATLLAGMGTTVTWTWIVAALGLVAAAILAVLSRSPRIGFDGTNVRFYVRAGSRVEVPVELVEGFLLGRGPTYLPGHANDTTETTTLVVRVSERAEEFNHVETTPTLAAWCGHYCTLRGTWTEPLSLALVNRLNQRLYDAQQARKKQTAAGASVGGISAAVPATAEHQSADQRVES
jgi:hypothetical protein